MDTPSIDEGLVDADVMFCFEPPIGWVRGTVRRDLRSQRNKFNFHIQWDDGDKMNVLLRADQYTSVGFVPASWFVIMQQ